MTDSQKQIDAIRQARAILERWQSSDLLDQIQSTEEFPPLVWSSDSLQPPPRRDDSVPVNAPTSEQPAATQTSASAGSVASRENSPLVSVVEDDDADVSPGSSEVRLTDPLQTGSNAADVSSPTNATLQPGGLADVRSPALVASREQGGSDLGVLQRSQGNPEAHPEIRRPLRRPAVQRRSRPASIPRKVYPGISDMNRTLRFDSGNAETPTSSPETLRATAAPATDLGFSTGALAESRTAAATQKARPVTGAPAAASTGVPVSNAATPLAGRRVRIDPPETVDAIAETSDGRTRTQGKARQRYIDEAHAGGLPGPHFQVTVPRRSNLTSLTGQFLAYLGVLGLTVGTAIVIYGHFGGYAEYTPTGWLITTVAQMMLFLGIINLVSGGMEQNNDEVSRRINTLGEQLLRIEQVTEQALRGPKLPPHLYQSERTPDDTPARQESITVP